MSWLTMVSLTEAPAVGARHKDETGGDRYRWRNEAGISHPDHGPRRAHDRHHLSWDVA